MGARVEPTTGIEPVTPSLPRKCSTTEPRGRRRGRGPMPRLGTGRVTARRPRLRDDAKRAAPGMERETGFGPATLSLEG